MITSEPDARTDTFVLMYPGWLVWDGPYWPVRVGGEFVASVEFVQRSRPETAASSHQLQVEHTDSNRYRATARVLDATDAVVLDLGSLRALRWIRPGEDSGDFSTGDTVSLDLSLSLNGWAGSTWTKRAAEQFGTDHRWRVERIVRRTADRDDATDIDEAAMETVDSANQYCLLYCSIVSGDPGQHPH